jgi:WD40 repeat protein
MSTQEHAIRYVDGGTVQAGDGVYVERSADEALLRTCQEGGFAYVLTSRQMGKSSLMIHTAEKLIEEGIRTPIVDLTELGANSTADQWYRGFLEKIAQQLELQACTAEWWKANQHISFAQRFNRFMMDVVLQQVPDRIVVFVDEIDTTLRLNFTDDFFASIRYLYHSRASSKESARLSFVLLGVATPSDLMKDPVRTPFNIGRRVDLQDFTEQEAIRGLYADAELVRSVFRHTGGHPYLTLRVFRSLADQPTSDVDRRIEALFFGEQSTKDSNLQFVRDMLIGRPRDPEVSPSTTEASGKETTTTHGIEAAAAAREAVLLRYRDVWKGKQVADQEADPVCARLRLSGIVRSEAGLLQVRNLIYRHVFDLTWIRANRVVNWVRRAAMAAVIAIAVFILVAAVLSPFALVQRREAIRARDQTELARVEAIQAKSEAERARDDERTQKERAAKNAAAAQRNAEMAKRNEQVSESNLKLARQFEAQAELSANESKLSAAEAMRQRTVAEQSLQEAQRQRHEAEATMRQSVSRALAYSATSSLSDDPERAILLGIDAVEATRAAGEAPVANAVDVLHRAILSSQVRLTLHGHSAGVNAATFSADNKLIATASYDGTVKLWDAVSGRELLTLRGHSKSVTDVAISSDTKILATAGDDAIIQLWDTTSGQQLLTLSNETGHVDRISRVVFSPDDKHISATRGDGTATIWDAADGRRLLTLRHLPLAGQNTPEIAVTDVAFSPNNKYLASAYSDGTAQIWDAATGRNIATVSAPVETSVDSLGGRSAPANRHNPSLSVAFSRDSTRLATGSSNGQIQIWGIAKKQVILTLSAHLSAVNRVAFSPDGERLATASDDGTAKVWVVVNSGESMGLDGHVDRPSMTLRGHTDRVIDVAFSGDGQRVVTASEDKTARVWEVAGASEMLTLRNFSADPNLAFGPDGQRIYTATQRDGGTVWDTTDGKQLLKFADPESDMRALAVSPDGRRIAASVGQEVKLWDAVSGRELLAMPGKGEDWVYGLAFSPDSSRLAAARYQGTVQVWDVTTGKHLLDIQDHSGIVFRVAFSPDGKRLASSGDDKIARVWDASSGQNLLTLSGHTEQIIGIAYSPDGKRLATASWDKTTKIWDATSGRDLLTLRGHAAAVIDVAFSPDGQTLATVSSDRTTKVWDVMTGRELLNLLGHTDLVGRVAYSPDGKRLATGSNDNSVQFYALELSDLLNLAHQRVTRDLTPEECTLYFPNQACPRFSAASNQ